MLSYEPHRIFVVIFFFNDTATTEIYTLSLHDALPIFIGHCWREDTIEWESELLSIHSPPDRPPHTIVPRPVQMPHPPLYLARSEEHTSELQSRQYLVCRLLLEKKKKIKLLNSIHYNIS